MKNKICILSYESIYFDGNSFFCDNIDMKSIPEGLSLNNEIKLIARNSEKKRSKSINISNIKVHKNLAKYLIEVIKTIKDKDFKYFAISLTPQTFLSIIILKLFGKKIFLYLRSDGFKEYNIILGTFGKFIYGIMFSISSIFSNLVACRQHLLRNRKGIIVNPSQLNQNWFKEIKETTTDDIRLLYVGRMRKEKGIFSLIDILKNKSDFNLEIINSEKDTTNQLHSNISVISFENYNDEIIKYYDKCNIFILPSYTEAHPQVLDEALARLRPVIVFNEIQHVTRNRNGVFVCDRNFDSLEKTCKHILTNYKDIQTKMRENILPTKDSFLKELENILKK